MEAEFSERFIAGISSEFQRRCVEAGLAPAKSLVAAVGLSAALADAVPESEAPRGPEGLEPEFAAALAALRILGRAWIDEAHRRRGTTPPVDGAEIVK